MVRTSNAPAPPDLRCSCITASGSSLSVRMSSTRESIRYGPFSATLPVEENERGTKIASGESPSAHTTAGDRNGDMGPNALPEP